MFFFWANERRKARHLASFWQARWFRKVRFIAPGRLAAASNRDTATKGRSCH
jgi:hypothetical protein